MISFPFCSSNPTGKNAETTGHSSFHSLQMSALKITLESVSSSLWKKLPPCLRHLHLLGSIIFLQLSNALNSHLKNLPPLYPPVDDLSQVLVFTSSSPLIHSSPNLLTQLKPLFLDTHSSLLFLSIPPLRSSSCSFPDPNKVLLFARWVLSSCHPTRTSLTFMDSVLEVFNMSAVQNHPLYTSTDWK